jgi:hypothetical protein
MPLFWLCYRHNSQKASASDRTRSNTSVASRWRRYSRTPQMTIGAAGANYIELNDCREPSRPVPSRLGGPPRPGYEEQPAAGLVACSDVMVQVLQIFCVRGATPSASAST